MSERSLLGLPRLLHPFHYQRRWLAMIQAYIDESGTHDQAKIIVMAGFLSSYKRWLKFEKQWNSVLNPDSGARVFHATDCLGTIGYGDFADWPKEERDKLVEALIPIIRTQTRASFTCAFSLKDYEEVVPEWIRQKWKHPYYVCMYTIANIIHVNRAKLSFPADEKIAFVFAHKPKFGGLLTDLYDELKYGTELFKNTLGKMTADGIPKEDVPLQAADLLAYVARTFYEKDYFQRDSAHKRTLDLARRLGLKNHLVPDFLDREALKTFARDYEAVHQQVGEWNWNARKTRTSKA